jgi:protein-arginine kinase activator protein McsA
MYYIELKKDQWKISLEKALEYYVEKEEYDRCIECRDLINKL